MRLPCRDVIATVLVVTAFVVFAAWSLGTAIPGFSAVGAVAAAVLVLGIAASALAVVPGFAGLLHGSRLYLALTSSLGVVALGAGLWALIGGATIGLTVLVVATIAMWALATARHAGRLRPQRIQRR